jgi:hypothetical protein
VTAPAADSSIPLIVQAAPIIISGSGWAPAAQLPVYGGVPVSY